MRQQRKISFMLLFVFIVSMGMTGVVEAREVHNRESKFIVNTPVEMPVKVYIDGVYEEDFDLKVGENILPVGLDQLDGPEKFWLELKDEFVGKVEVKGSQYKGKTFGLPIYYGGNIRVDFIEVGEEIENNFIVNSPVEMPVKVYIDGVYEEDFDLKVGENILPVGLDQLDGPEMYWLELQDEFVGKVEVNASPYKGKTFGLPIYYGGDIVVDLVTMDRFIVNSPVEMPVKVYIDGIYEEDFDLKVGENILPVGLDQLDGPEMYWLELKDEFVGKVEVNASPYKGKTFGLPVYYGGDILVDFVKVEEEVKEVEFKLGAARLVDDFELVLDYSKEIEKVDYFKLEFKNQVELIDEDGSKIRLSNYRLRDGKLVANYDRKSRPAKVNIKADDIFTSLDGDKNKVETNIGITDNRPEIIRSGISVEKLAAKEMRANITFAEDLDIFSLVGNLRVTVNGRPAKTNKKFNKTDGLISLGFVAKDELKLGDKVVLSFQDIETVSGRLIDNFDHELELSLDRKLDKKIEALDKEMEDYIFDLTSPVGLLGLTQEMNQKDFWPTPAFENALNALRDNLVNFENVLAKAEKDIEEVRAISGPDYDKLLALEKSRDYLVTSLKFANDELLPKGDFFIAEANKTEAIKRRMRDIAYKLHKHRVHSFLLEPEELDRLLDSMPGERLEADKIELGYMKKMAMDDIDEMEAKLKVVKVACDFYLEEDLDLAYSQIAYVKEQLMRLPADIGNELYDFIEDKINLAIEFHNAQSGDEDSEGVFKVEEVNLLDGNVVEIKLSNPITWYDQHFKDTNCMFVLKTSEEEGYHNFVSVEKTEIELKGKTVRLTPRNGVVASHFEVPNGVPIKDARGMTPQEMGISKINDLRTK